MDSLLKIQLALKSCSFFCVVISRGKPATTGTLVNLYPMLFEINFNKVLHVCVVIYPSIDSVISYLKEML